MESADMTEVFKRLSETSKPVYDEQHKELPIPEERQIEEPLFLKTR